MRIKHAKRSASEYQSSISSQQSCYDSIITQIQLSSSIITQSSSYSNIMVAKQCRTPPRNIVNNEKNYSLKRLDSDTMNEWRQTNNQNGSQQDNWHFESEDSKMRNKQHNYGQIQKLKYKKHARILKFQQQKCFDNAQKQNQPIRINIQESSSDQQNIQIQNLRKNSSRKVGKLLYMQKKQFKTDAFKLKQIIQQDSCNFL